MTQSELPLFEAARAASAPPVRPPPPAPPSRGAGSPPPMQPDSVALAEETKKRYLNYALSVVSSRALPDVRDGLKPVQRRILYGMQRAGVRSDGKYVKCARVVGDVMGQYHPHGDNAIYDALARMAQSFTLRVPLVDGQGNFGSPDGDAPAAMRYTECRLSKAAGELLAELDRGTVDFRPNYDGEKEEPVVLPARFPNLLVNGSSGIAVGMATSIPPHNLGEVIDAAVALIDEPTSTTKQLLKFVKGPDFPTGGQVVSTRAEIAEVYETGQGSLKVRGTHKLEEPSSSSGRGGNPLIILTSIPYAIERKTIVERIAEVIIEKRLPLLLDVRDESTDETRIVLEIKKGTDPQLVLAYLYKNTPLQTNVQVNMTCLVPIQSGGVETTVPERLTLHGMLRHWLDFRMRVVVRRTEHDLAEIQRRIHILEGFVTIFDALDETIRIIRRSQGKKDAAEKLMTRFTLSAEQVEAILELRLYRLAQLEIHVIREELAEKQKEAARLAQLLKSESARWKLIKAELSELRVSYADKRATKVASVDEPEFSEEAFIVDEDAFVILSREGWIKRQGSVKDLAATRTREGDAVLDVAAGSTKSVVALFSSLGACYVSRIVDVPASTGYGTPVQSLFKLADGERIVRMLSFDPRLLEVPPPTETDGPLLGGAEPEPPHALAVTKAGQCLRFSLRPHREPSTRAGRKYARLTEMPGDEVLYVAQVKGDEKLAAATVQGHALLTKVDEVPVLAGAGKGVRLVKIEEKDDAVIGVRVLRDSSDVLVVEHENGKTFEVTVWKDLVARGGKGTPLFKRGVAIRVLPEGPTLPVLPAKEGA
jgi:DNA gyrase subunit A